MEPDEYQRMNEVEASMWWYRALHARLLDALASGNSPADSGPILDAGCGTGGFLMKLGRVREVVGLEWNPLAARMAATKSGRPVVAGSIDALPFSDKSFGAAIAADVLCHANVDPAAALAEIGRILRPNGRLIANMPAFRVLMSVHDIQVHNVRRVTAGQMRAMLEAAGFRVLSVRYWNGLLLPLMIVQRKLRPRSPGRSDVAAFPPCLDRMFHAMTELERRLPFPLFAGGSVLSIAERP
jgi:SAM-dependent methyltransferase